MNKPILVTGAHRSGATWVGKIIAGVELISKEFYGEEDW